MYTVKCCNCGQENKFTNIRCEACGKVLLDIKQNIDYSQTNEENIKYESKDEECNIFIILIIFLFPFFLGGLAFAGIGSYCVIKDNIKSKNYLETKGELVEYIDYQDDDVCKGVYEYTVNGETYRGSPKSSKNSSMFKQTVTVKYNPNNPSEYVIDAGWSILIIVGIILIIVNIVIFIKAMKK